MNSFRNRCNKLCCVKVNAVKKAAANKAILYLERVLVQANIQVTT